MWKHTLCLSLNTQFGIPAEEQMKLIKDAGFDAFFMCWNEDGDVDKCAALAKELGLIFQSIHAPWTKAADMWGDDEEKGRIAIDELIACVNDCIKHEVPILVVHAFIGFEDHTPTAIGLKRFGEVVKYAADNNIQIAFENTEGEEYLAALMEEFKDYKNVGFCWDTGHEMCYNWSKDMLELYGDRLIATHLNDNCGIKDHDGKITWIDDLHLLPFDGIADWNNIVDRLDRHNYQGILTFELNTLSKPNRHENDKYGAMPIEQYIAECFIRACRVANMRKI